MALTHIQQKQISGSLSGGINDNVSTLVGDNRTLLDDLNSLRTQMRAVIDGNAWTNSVSQNLDDIYTFAQGSGVDVVLQGAAEVTTTLTVQGASDLNGALDVAGVADFASNVYTAADLGVSGALAVAGQADFADAVNVIGLASLDGGVDVGSWFSVDASGNLDAATLDIGGGYGDTGLSVSGAGNLQMNGNATIDGTLNAGASLLSSATVSSTLDVGGASSFAGAATMNSLSVTGSLGVAISEGLVVQGAADFNGGVAANSIAIDSDVATRLYIVDGDGTMKDEAKLTFDGSDLSVTGGLRVSGNATVDGDLMVKGAFTYIETQNMSVKDAFIYLATGSAGSSDSGIVFSKGAGASYDLVIGQDGGAGEIIFASQPHSASFTSPADLAGSELVQMWAEGVKLGGVQGSLSGSLVASAGGVALSSQSGMAVSAASSLLLAANGNASVSFADSAQAPTGFTATSIIGMLNELKSDITTAGAGGNIQKDVYDGNQLSSNQLTLSNAPSSAAAKLLDVYLNGVLLELGANSGAGTEVWFAGSAGLIEFASGLSIISGDKITVIVRG